jgi:hypothetical protein
MNRLGLFLSDLFLHTKQRQAFLEWMLFLSLFFVADFVLNLYLLRFFDTFTLVVAILLAHFVYFVWLAFVLAEDGRALRQMIRLGQYKERVFKRFLSRLIPIFFLLSPGFGGMVLGFIVVFFLSKPLGFIMTWRAKIDWQSVYELLRMEEEKF